MHKIAEIFILCSKGESADRFYGGGGLRQEFEWTSSDCAEADDDEFKFREGLAKDALDRFGEKAIDNANRHYDGNQVFIHHFVTLPTNVATLDGGNVYVKLLSLTGTGV